MHKSEKYIAKICAVAISWAAVLSCSTVHIKPVAPPKPAASPPVRTQPALAARPAVVTAAPPAPAPAHNTINTNLPALLGVWAYSETLAYAVGASGSILKWNGLAWSQENSGTELTLRSIWGPDPSHTWAVGEKGTVLFNDGSGWREQPFVDRQRLNDVFGTALDRLWVVGEAGRIFHWNGFRWFPEDSGTRAAISAVWAWEKDQAWAVSQNGNILRRQKGVWRLEDPDISRPQLWDIWGANDADITAVGSFNTVLHWDGQAWKEINRCQCEASDGYCSEDCERYQAAWGSHGNNMWIADNSGNIVHQTAAGQTLLHDPPANLLAIHGLHDKSIWAVGEYGTMMHWDGQTWATVKMEQAEQTRRSPR